MMGHRSGIIAIVLLDGESEATRRDDIAHSQPNAQVVGVRTLQVGDKIAVLHCRPPSSLPHLKGGNRDVPHNEARNLNIHAQSIRKALRIKFDSPKNLILSLELKATKANARFVNGDHNRSMGQSLTDKNIDHLPDFKIARLDYGLLNKGSSFDL